MDSENLDNPDYYINRELSLLEFHARVLAQTLDESIPLLERLNFLVIFSSNLDEFFEIRVSNLKRQIKFDTLSTGPDNLSPKATLEKISEVAHQLVEEQYRIFNEVLMPALNKENIYCLAQNQWNDEQKQWLKRYFKQQVQSVITPIGLDLAHPFPRLINKSLNFIISLEGKDAFGRDSGLAVIHAPRSLPRLIALPENLSKDRSEFVYLSSIIEAHADDLFPGMTITGCYQFRLTRDSDLYLVAEEVEDLPRALKGELISRRFGDAVRLEIDQDCPEHILKFLLQKFHLEQEEAYTVNGPVNLERLAMILELVSKPELRYPELIPAAPEILKQKVSIFELLKEQDILLHHPFESFTPVIDFVREAAKDPNVLAIKQTLYRTGADSEMVKALLEAARAGKEVTAVVELRARFDEEENIDLADRLQQAGALVVYGVIGYKTHAKMSLVIRREKRSLKRYVHLSTGNYHNENAKQYTDFGLLSSDKEVCEDVNSVFQQLTGMGKATKLKKIWNAPFILKKNLLDAIKNEMELAKQGKDALIIAKLNALTEPNMIKALYEASQAGVKIDLIVRGICCLRPGITGVSENIRVRSIVGRFLEHARVYYFANDGEPKLFCASADWMERNLHHRIEVCFPIEDPKLAERVRKEGLNSYLSDNCSSWQLRKDASYKRNTPGSQSERNVQQGLLERFK